jgi:uncharacterized membrane protein YphA (DoxX/SURF4 family)
MAWITIATEVLGGVAILLGAFVSVVSIPAVTLLIVATATVHLPYGFSSIKLMSFSNGRAHLARRAMSALCSTLPPSSRWCSAIRVRGRYARPIGYSGASESEEGA